MKLEAFRAEVVAFLDGHAPRHTGRDGAGPAWGEGDDTVALLPERDEARERADLDAARAWARTRFDAGFGWVDGPPELGGRGLSPAHAHLYDEIEAGYELPDAADLFIGRRIVAPTLAAHAAEAVRRACVPAIHRGDLVACQLFSEPGAGSDLASLTTRAERDGDGWALSGQKVWTSGAHLADVGEIICRSDPEAPRHRGLTAFVVDMSAPGVEVRRIRQMNGGNHFNEVFLDRVPVPDSQRLGDVGGGWAVALTTLMCERAAIGSGGSVLPGGELTDRLRAVAAHLAGGAAAGSAARDALVAAVVAATINGWTTRRLTGPLRRGAPPGPELALTKLAATGYLRSCADVVTRLLGPRLAADTGEWGAFCWAPFVCGVPGTRLAGGSDEILRNILAERVLGLPRDPEPPPAAPAPGEGR